MFLFGSLIHSGPKCLAMHLSFSGSHIQCWDEHQASCAKMIKSGSKCILKNNTYCKILCSTLVSSITEF